MHCADVDNGIQGDLAALIFSGAPSLLNRLGCFACPRLSGPCFGVCLPDTRCTPACFLTTICIFQPATTVPDAFSRCLQVLLRLDQPPHPLLALSCHHSVPWPGSEFCRVCFVQHAVVCTLQGRSVRGTHLSMLYILKLACAWMRQICKMHHSITCLYLLSNTILYYTILSCSL